MYLCGLIHHYFCSIVVHLDKLFCTLHRLPLEVASSAAHFEEFYLEKHSGRELAWLTEKGQGEVRTLITAKRHELVVPTYQMVILCCFNSSAKLRVRYVDCVVFLVVLIVS